MQLSSQRVSDFEPLTVSSQTVSDQTVVSDGYLEKDVFRPVASAQGLAQYQLSSYIDFNKCSALCPIATSTGFSLTRM